MKVRRADCIVWICLNFVSLEFSKTIKRTVKIDRQEARRKMPGEECSVVDRASKRILKRVGEYKERMD